MEVTQPPIKRLVMYANVMEYEYVCDSWHHWSPQMAL